ncbi:MAG: NTP/NDP exchange transporter [Candidatus Babeliales bacterium]
MLNGVVSRLKSFATSMWGEFESREELQKFLFLGAIFGLIIGSYWAFRPIKDSIFAAIVGVDWQPRAKWLSLLIIVPLVIIYSKLIDMFPRQKLFYVLTVFYGIASLVFAYYLSHPVYGLPNTTTDSTRIIGWLWYVFVESFGSLIVALFWAITVDITPEDSARRGFPIIALLGQMGNIFGPYFLRAKRLGFANSSPIIAIVGVFCFGMAFLMWLFLKTTPKRQLKGFESKDTAAKREGEEPGFWEGLKLLLTQPYLLGIFLVVSIYEVIVTIFDFLLKAMSKAAFPIEIDHAEYLNNYAVMTGVVATLCVIFGINNIQRKMGMTASLVLMPLLVGTAVFVLYADPSLSIVFWIMVIAKAVNYALNQPTLKQLYIPTSTDTKYKSQAWIEMFGSRGSKAAGSYINDYRGLFIKNQGYLDGAAWFIVVSSVISLGLIGVWFFIAVYVARTYNTAIKRKEVIC